MSDDNPSAISHISVGTNDFERSVRFYDSVLAVLGCKRIMQHLGAAAWGKELPEFWVQTPIDGRPASVGNGTHIGFLAVDKTQVHAFHKAALAAGARDEGAPGPRRSTASPTTAASCATPTGTRSRPRTGTWRSSRSFSRIRRCR